MGNIMFVSGLIAILGVVLVWNVVRLIKAKVKGEELHLKRKLPMLGILLVLISALFAYNVYLGISLAVQNKDVVLDYGQKAVEKSVEYGTTAVLEGLGNTIEHFEEKWSEQYVEHLKNVEIEVKEITRESVSDKNDKLIIDLIFNNKNTAKEILSLYYLAENNYLLVGDKNEVYYPLSLSDNSYQRNLPSGKTIVSLESIVPKGTEIAYVRLLDVKSKIDNK